MCNTDRNFADKLFAFGVQNMRNTTTTFRDGVCERCAAPAVVGGYESLCAACWLKMHGNPLIAGESLPLGEHRTAEQVRRDNDEMDSEQNYPHEL